MKYSSDWYRGKSCTLHIDLYCLLNYGRVNTLNANFCTPVTFFIFLISSGMYVNKAIEVTADPLLKIKSFCSTMFCHLFVIF